MIPDRTREQLIQENEELRRRIGGLEAQLAERNEFYERMSWLSSVVQHASLGLAASDLEGRLTFVNEAFARLHGYAPDEAVGKHLSIFHSPEQIPAVEEAMAACLEKGVYAGEVLHVRRDGTVLPTFMQAELLRDRSGKPVGMVGTVRDITEQKRVEDALRESEQSFRSIYETANDGIFIHEMETGRILDVNPKMCEMYGYTPEEARSIDVDRLSSGASPYDQEHAVGLIQKAVAGDPQIFEWNARDKNGRLFWVEVNLKRARIGEKDRILAIVRDIAERKRIEEERVAIDRRIQEGQKQESLGLMAGGIAHDFNNLLMGVLGNADLALLDLSPESPALPCVKDIRIAAIRLAELTRQMLAYSGKGKFVVEPINLSVLVEEMGHLLAASISKKAVVRYDLETRLPPIHADASQIRQVVMNLIINASEAIGDKSGVIALRTGTVKVEADYLSEFFPGQGVPQGSYVFLEVSDNGHGMDPETVPKIFDPYFSTKFAGRGLGLAAVLGIVRGHGGRIRVYSEPNRGTTFKLIFPSAGDAEPVVPEGDAGAGTASAGGTILLVDDEGAVLSVTRRMLERAGFAVLTAGDGRQALEVLRVNRGEVSAVLLDLTMPHLDGVETCKKIRRLFPSLPVVLSSGYSEQDATSQFAGKGLAGFIQKPYEMKSLIEELRKALTRRSA